MHSDFRQNSDLRILGALDFLECASQGKVWLLFQLYTPIQYNIKKLNAFQIKLLFKHIGIDCYQRFNYIHSQSGALLQCTGLKSFKEIPYNKDVVFVRLTFITSI